jgi:hypothetical protein
MNTSFTVERALRGLAGTVVLVSVSLGYLVHPAWLLPAVFAGVNLLQSAFTNACPAMTIFRRLGLPDAGPGPPPRDEAA